MVQTASKTLSALLFWTVTFGMHSVFAQTIDDLVVIKKNGTEKSTPSTDATKALQAKLTAEAAREQVLAIVGEKRYQKNKALIESKIIRQSAKYIPYVSPGAPQISANGDWTLALELRLSSSSLRKMISEAGVLNDAEGVSGVLPLVTFVDRTKGATLRWWQGEPKDDAHRVLSAISNLFYEKFQVAFAKEGFRFNRPPSGPTSPLPESSRADEPSVVDLGFIGDQYKSPMILKGEVRTKESKNTPGAFFCSIKLQVVQTSGGRSIADVSRQFLTEAGGYESVVTKKFAAEFSEIGKDLAAQVLEVVQRGTLNTNAVKLTVRGQLGPKQAGEFKSQLSQNVREIKFLKERLFESGQTVFEADSAGSSAQLAEKIKSAKLPGFEARVAEYGPDSVVMDVRAR